MYPHLPPLRLHHVDVHVSQAGTAFLRTLWRNWRIADTVLLMNTSSILTAFLESDRQIDFSMHRLASPLHSTSRGTRLEQIYAVIGLRFVMRYENESCRDNSVYLFIWTFKGIGILLTPEIQELSYVNLQMSYGFWSLLHHPINHDEYADTATRMEQVRGWRKWMPNVNNDLGIPQSFKASQASVPAFPSYPYTSSDERRVREARWCRFLLKGLGSSRQFNVQRSALSVTAISRVPRPR